MFRICFTQSFIRLVVLIVLGDQCQRVTSDKNYGALKPSYLEHGRPIYDRSSELDGDFVGGERETILWGDSSERNSEHGRDGGPTGNSGTDPVADVTRTEILAYAPRLFGSRRETRIRTAPVRKRRQMVEYYVDSIDGIIETRPSRKGQYHVALGERSSKKAVAEERDKRVISESKEIRAVAEEGDVGDTSDRKEPGAKVNVYRPQVVNDDSGESENVFFSEAKLGQNREALNLFLARSERSAEPDSQLAGQNSRHHGFISSINDVPGTEEPEWLLVEHKGSGQAKQPNAGQADLPHRGKKLSDFGNTSTQNAKKILLRHIVKSILKNDTVASYFTKASGRSKRGKRQILEYLVDSLTGKIDKRDTNARLASTKDRTAKRHVSVAHEQKEELARNAYENDKRRRQRGLSRRNGAEEAGRSVDHDSDDLEDVLQNRAQRDESNADLNDNEERRGSDDDNSNVRRHNYDISDDTAEADDVRSYGKRRLAYEDPEPTDDAQEEDFYYVEEESSVVKRETGQQNNEKLDRAFEDSVGEQDVQRSQRAAAPPSEEERKLLSKELVEIMLKEIDDRLQGKPGNPDLQVRGPVVLTNPQEKDKSENPEMLKQNHSVSVENKRKRFASKLRTKRRVSRSAPTDEIKRRFTQLEDDFDKLEAKRSPTEEKLEQSKEPTPDEDAEEEAEDLDMTKQLVAIVIEHAVRELRNLASSGSSAKRLPTTTEQPEQIPNSRDQIPESRDQIPKSRDQDAVLVPPLMIQANEQRETTPFGFWDVEPIPKDQLPNTLVNTSDEYFADGFRYQRVTYPPINVNSKFTDTGSHPTRKQRREILLEDDKIFADFSASAGKTRAGKRVFDAVETVIFCRVIRRLVDQGKLPPESYESLISNNTCLRFPPPLRIRRSIFRIPTFAPCLNTDDGDECREMTLPPIDPLTGDMADPRCEELTYIPIYPTVFNVYQGQVTARIPMWNIYGDGGYIWGGIGTGIQPPAVPPKRNSVWGVVFSFSLPFRLWGFRFIETPLTAGVVSIAVYLKRFDDTENRWTAVTEDGSKEPQIIPVTSPVIHFTEIHVVTGILIFLQEWRGHPILPHPVFISCSLSSLEDSNSFDLPIVRSSSWDSILKAIARDSKTYEIP